MLGAMILKHWTGHAHGSIHRIAIENNLVECQGPPMSPVQEMNSAKGQKLSLGNCGTFKNWGCMRHHEEESHPARSAKAPSAPASWSSTSLFIHRGWWCLHIHNFSFRQPREVSRASVQLVYVTLPVLSEVSQLLLQGLGQRSWTREQTPSQKRATKEAAASAVCCRFNSKSTAAFPDGQPGASSSS